MLKHIAWVFIDSELIMVTRPRRGGRCPSPLQPRVPLNESAPETGWSKMVISYSQELCYTPCRGKGATRVRDLQELTTNFGTYDSGADQAKITNKNNLVFKPCS